MRRVCGTGHCAQEEEATQQRKRELLAAQQAQPGARATCAVRVARCLVRVACSRPSAPANVPFQLDVRAVCLQRAIETRQREAQRQQLRALMAQKAEEEAQKRRRAEADARAVEAEAEVKRQAELEEAKRHAAAAAVRWQHRAAWRDCVRQIVHGTLHVACGVFHIARVPYRTA